MVRLFILATWRMRWHDPASRPDRLFLALMAAMAVLLMLSAGFALHDTRIRQISTLLGLE